MSMADQGELGVAQRQPSTRVPLSKIRSRRIGHSVGTGRGRVRLRRIRPRLITSDVPGCEWQVCGRLIKMDHIPPTPKRNACSTAARSGGAISGVLGAEVPPAPRGREKGGLCVPCRQRTGEGLCVALGVWEGLGRCEGGGGGHMRPHQVMVCGGGAWPHVCEVRVGAASVRPPPGGR